MTKVLRGKLNERGRREILSVFLNFIGKIESVADANNFLDLFFTRDEKELIFRRIAIMRLIARGKSYREIRAYIGASNNTISETRDILNGSGYRKRNKKKQWSFHPAKDKRRLIPPPPAYSGRGRWKFLNNL